MRTQHTYTTIRTRSKNSFIYHFAFALFCTFSIFIVLFALNEAISKEHCLRLDTQISEMVKYNLKDFYITAREKSACEARGINLNAPILQGIDKNN
jgi:hypothetical protein